MWVVWLLGKVLEYLSVQPPNLYSGEGEKTGKTGKTGKKGEGREGKEKKRMTVAAIRMWEPLK